MGSTRRAFTDEYKAHAVELVINDGRTIADAARAAGHFHVHVDGTLIANDRPHLDDDGDRRYASPRHQRDVAV
ncbi:MAG TPA: hypothetical protein VES01_09080 [Dermatophilaceae bacterium]|nr:hypothetical protein [Dermatophilaceae bacterium]